MSKNEVTKAQATDVQLPEDIDLYGDAGIGNENLTQDDMIIPRLKIIQSGSPQMKKSKPEYMENAREGMVINTATQMIIPTPLIVVPVAYQRRYIEWVPLDNGGGLVNPDHDESILEQCTQEGGSYMLPNGNEIVDTPEHFVLYVGEEGMVEQAVMSMPSTQAKVSRQWNTLIRNLKIRNPKTGMFINPARFYGAYEFDTVPESNDKGDWTNWKVKYLKPVLELPEGVDIYRAAREFYSLVNEGKVKAEVEQPGGSAASGPADTDAF